MKITVYLLFSVGIDWSDGRSHLQNVYGSVYQAQNSDHVPESLRKDWKPVNNDNYDGKSNNSRGTKIYSCVYFDIYAKEIDVPWHAV